jgi:hypothetical protein
MQSAACSPQLNKKEQEAEQKKNNVHYPGKRRCSFRPKLAEQNDTVQNDEKDQDGFAVHEINDLIRPYSLKKRICYRKSSIVPLRFSFWLSTPIALRL